MDCWIIFHYRLAKFRMSLGRTLPYWPLVLIPGSDTAPVGIPSTHKLLVAKWMAYFPHLNSDFKVKGGANLTLGLWIDLLQVVARQCTQSHGSGAGVVVKLGRPTHL